MKRTTYISLMILFIANTLVAQNSNRIKVEGQARISEVPEEIIVSVDLTVKDSLYQECFSKAMESLKTLKHTFEKNGIDPKFIKSKAISVNEAYEWQQNKRIKSGYVANISLEVKDAFTQKFSDALLKSLNRADLNINYRLAFGFSEAQKEKLKAKAIELAVADAQQKAEIIANAAGVKLTGIANINYGADTPSFRPMDMMMDKEMTPAITRADNFSGVDLNPKEQVIISAIYMEWTFAE
ncbi:SIMPL domain-containing protein [Carboxylicivirga sediminis]|uniref:SIMPL domain-containing protein n=1 Tax=Carboxylicivirga sediminis TaxID=2006564 RepID=A0A941F5M5_9BACT|nr:SIMPL domain-containing protein [Carboxylicivirga sediminis]MBR8537246.1 SIMPL domain-containing protein [Carboxylicivirga sediminis]